jgi:hypothetical protein
MISAPLSILGRAALAMAPAVLLAACSGDAGPSREVTALGTVEVTARLVQVLGKFMPNDNYDYVHVMKYEVLQVHRGEVQGKEIFVGHYNPLKPRARAADRFVEKIGGNVDRFQVGDVHRMALESPLDDIYMGGVIDKHFEEKGTRYWAVWTDRAR